MTKPSPYPTPLKQLFFGLTTHLSASEKLGLNHAVKQMLVRPKLLVFLVVASTAAAVFEGGTIGILGLAVSVLVGEEATLSTGAFGKLSIVLDALLMRYSPSGVFLVLVGIAIIVQVFKSLLIYISTAAQIYLAMEVRLGTQEKVVAHMMRLSYPRISEYPPGSLASFIDQSSCAQDVVDLTSNTTRAVLMFIVYVGLMLWVSVPMSVVGGIAVVLMWFALSRAIRKIKKLSTEAASAKIFLWRWTVELLSAPRLLRLFNSTDTAREMIKKAREAELIPERKAAIIDAAIKPSLEFFAVFGAGVFLIAGYALAGDGAAAAIPSLFVFVVVFYRLKPQLQALNDFRAKLAKLLPRLSILGEFLRADDESFEKFHGENIQSFEKGIEFHEVGFQYPGSKNEVLTNISFSLLKGKTIALVGASGAGKSTITDLVAGLHQPTSGTITVDGVDLSALNVKSWRAQLGVVEQNVLLLNASVKENICFGRETSSLETVKAAARAAHADEFIDNLELGYDTILGDKGFKLSGGQKQRIALARALYGNPDLLILDEATSALDSVSEKLIQQALAEMKKSRTILVVAHRLSTIADADEILVLEGGQILERGNKDALLSKEGKFAHLWRMQI